MGEVDTGDWILLGNAGLADCRGLDMILLDKDYRYLRQYFVLSLHSAVFWERVLNLNQSEASEHCFPASDWLNFGPFQKLSYLFHRTCKPPEETSLLLFTISYFQGGQT